MLHAASPALPGTTGCCNVVELRQYSLHPGKRDVLIELFDREFIETQEAVGMTVIGQFRDLDRPDRFVWMRGFPDMTARAASLAAFYGGPAWKAHRNAANATMIDSDNVLLLEPASSATRETHLPHRASPEASAAEGRIIIATIYYLKPGVREPETAKPAAGEPGASAEGDAMARFAEFFSGALRPALQEAGATSLGCYATSKHRNNFPGLPVREGELAFLWLGRFGSLPAYERFQASLRRNARWNGAREALESRLQRAPETLRLAPTSRSRL